MINDEYSRIRDDYKRWGTKRITRGQYMYRSLWNLGMNRTMGQFSFKSNSQRASKFPTIHRSANIAHDPSRSPVLPTMGQHQRT